MKKLFLFSTLLWSHFLFLSAQFTGLYNGNFENLFSPPTAKSQIDKAIGWKSIILTPDLIGCKRSRLGIERSRLGIERSRNAVLVMLMLGMCMLWNMAWGKGRRKYMNHGPNKFMQD